MRIIDGTLLYDGTKTEDGRFVPLSDVRELIHSVDSIRLAHERLLREITHARVAIERLTSAQNHYSLRVQAGGNHVREDTQ